MYFGQTLGTCFRDEVDQCKNTASIRPVVFFSFFFCHLVNTRVRLIVRQERWNMMSAITVSTFI